MTLLFAGCGHEAAGGVSVDKEFRSSIPPDTQAMIFIQLDKLKSTELYRRHQQEFDLPQMNALSERVGMDPRRDLSKMLVVWNGKQPLILAEGKFSTEQVKQKLTAEGATRTSYKEYTLFGGPNDSVAFVDKQLAFAGPADFLHKVLDLHAGDDGTVPDELAKRMETVPKDSQIWEVSTGGIPFANLILRSDLQSAMANIAGYVSATSLGVNLDSGARVRADIFCISSEGSQRVHDALRGMIGLARLSTNDNEIDLLRLWDAVSISQDEKAVHIKADLPADLTEKLLTHLPSLRGKAGAILNR
jgi:hypothetical protein